MSSGLLGAPLEELQQATFVQVDLLSQLYAGVWNSSKDWDSSDKSGEPRLDGCD